MYKKIYYWSYFLYVFQTEEEEELVSDEEDEIIIQTEPPKQDKKPPVPPPPATDVDLLNWGSNTLPQVNQNTHGIDLLNISSEQQTTTGMKKDPSNFDLLSGFESSTTDSHSSNTATNSGNLFDPFAGVTGGNNEGITQPSAQQSNTPDLLGQFSTSNLASNNSFSNFKSPVSIYYYFEIICVFL